MEVEQVLQQAHRIIRSNVSSYTLLAESLEFLRIYSGADSSFYIELSKANHKWSDNYLKNFTTSIMLGFISFIEHGLDSGISLERKAQIDVVSDFLDQAMNLLNTKGVHPAAPCVLIGASLEEFLRNWVEESGLMESLSKPTLDSLSKALKSKDLLTKQDMKDIASWSGLRNYAAHGEWEEVNDKRRITLMLEGVNLFMRKYETR